jgi:hypothetical protein
VIRAAHTASTDLCSDADLGYERSRTRFATGAGLVLDEQYRLAHLPLIAPHHPDVIAEREGTSYQLGRHPRVVSLVLPMPQDSLGRSAAYRELDAELQAMPFSGKIAWDLLERRRANLHATICGSLAIGEEAPVLDAVQRRELARLGPVEVEVRGMFSGNLNVGRLYLRVYPERREGANVFRQVQSVLGRRPTDLYLVGIWNLLDHLDPPEADALAALIERWWERPILRFRADRLWLLAARDDLVLDSEILEVLELGQR